MFSNAYSRHDLHCTVACTGKDVLHKALHTNVVRCRLESLHIIVACIRVHRCCRWTTASLSIAWYHGKQTKKWSAHCGPESWGVEMVFTFTQHHLSWLLLTVLRQSALRHSARREGRLTDNMTITDRRQLDNDRLVDWLSHHYICLSPHQAVSLSVTCFACL